ncbi:MAG: flagellar protein FliS [Lachnospiraceae bacterium]|nr:flagellar protein FliS [Lachnospiraceae bacterium]
MTNEKKQEYTRRISQANSTEMVVVIYDITLTYIEDAAKALEAGDKQELSASMIRIRKCINELIASLHYDYSPAGELLMLYSYCSRRLTAVQTKGDKEALGEISSILKRLRDAYDQISSTNSSGAVMSNSESVYAGLTYGRSSLNEDVIGNSNRGFLA